MPYANEPLTNSNVGGPFAEVTLSGDDLIVECSQVQSMGGPCVKVVAGADRSAGALALADGPVLVKGCSTLNRGLVHALSLVDIVS